MGWRKRFSTLKHSIKWRTYKWHGFLLVVLAVECLTALILHQSDDELRQVLDEGCQQVKTLFVLTNRGVPNAIDHGTIQRLLYGNNNLVREWTMTTNFTRFAAPRLQEMYIKSLGDSEEAFRCRFLLTYRIGQLRWMKLSEFYRFLEVKKG